MENLNIPIFRAKRLDSSEYVFGVPRQDSKGMYEMIINVVNDGVPGVIQRYIDITTLSIHFHDMLDSQGNKIFASLDIKGGSLIEYEEKIFEAMYLNGLIQGVANMDSIQNSLFKYSKIIGIQQ